MSEGRRTMAIVNPPQGIVSWLLSRAVRGALEAREEREAIRARLLEAREDRTAARRARELAAVLEEVASERPEKP